MASKSTPALDRADAFRRLFATKIVVLDGAMGSLLQALNLEENDFRAERFKSHPGTLKGAYDLLCLTRPELIEKIHGDYFAAGADLVETNTFSSNSLALAEYHCAPLVRDINLAAVACARRAAQRTEAATPGLQCFVAGAIGPLNRSLSLSDTSRPDYRAVTWDQVVAAYTEQVEALLDGGVDALLVETIFDARNSQAALHAIEQIFERRGAVARVPVMVSVTISEKSGRLLSGETVSGFYEGIAPTKPFSIGINCSFGGAAMRPHIEELARVASCYTTCYPNAGLPNALGGYDETPADMAKILGEFARNGWVNLVGGCCGSTPTHIAAIAEAVRGRAPRQLPQAANALRLSGHGPFAIT